MGPNYIIAIFFLFGLPVYMNGCRPHWWSRFIFTFSTIRSIGKVFHLPKKIDFQILMNLHVLRAIDSKNVIFGMSSVCVCVSVCLCVSVCGHYNSRNNWASSTKFGMWSYMIKNLGRYCIWAKSAHGCGLCPESTIRFLGKKCLKKALHKHFSRTKVVTNHNTQLLVQRLLWSPHGCGLCPERIIRFFGEKCLKNAL